MFDVLNRALRHPQDYWGIIKTHRLTLTEHEELGDNIHTFVFAMPRPFLWQAGQHGIFSLPGRPVSGKTWRPFSLASSAQENVVRIATVIPPERSSFKNELEKLAIGDQILLRGPYGEFHAYKDHDHIVGIAGGIGITPFRALAYDISHGFLPNKKLTLIYSAREVYPFKDELISWQNDNLAVTFNHTPEEVNLALAEAWAAYGNQAAYYISGAPGMITALDKTCHEFGVDKVVYDPFKGY